MSTKPREEVDETYLHFLLDEHSRRALSSLLELAAREYRAAKGRLSFEIPRGLDICKITSGTIDLGRPSIAGNITPDQATFRVSLSHPYIDVDREDQNQSYKYREKLALFYQISLPSRTETLVKDVLLNGNGVQFGPCAPVKLAAITQSAGSKELEQHFLAGLRENLSPGFRGTLANLGVRSGRTVYQYCRYGSIIGFSNRTPQENEELARAFGAVMLAEDNQEWTEDNVSRIYKKVVREQQRKQFKTEREEPVVQHHPAIVKVPGYDYNNDSESYEDTSSNENGQNGREQFSNGSNRRQPAILEIQDTPRREMGTKIKRNNNTEKYNPVDGKNMASELLGAFKQRLELDAQRHGKKSKQKLSAHSKVVQRPATASRKAPRRNERFGDQDEDWVEATSEDENNIIGQMAEDHAVKLSEKDAQINALMEQVTALHHSQRQLEHQQREMILNQSLTPRTPPQFSPLGQQTPTGFGLLQAGRGAPQQQQGGMSGLTSPTFSGIAASSINGDSSPRRASHTEHQGLIAPQVMTPRPAAPSHPGTPRNATPGLNILSSPLQVNTVGRFPLRQRGTPNGGNN